MRIYIRKIFNRVINFFVSNGVTREIGYNCSVKSTICSHYVISVNFNLDLFSFFKNFIKWTTQSDLPRNNNSHTNIMGRNSNGFHRRSQTMQTLGRIITNHTNYIFRGQ